MSVHKDKEASTQNKLNKRKAKMAYKFATHLKNLDNLSELEWGFKTLDLLEELRRIDPTTYDQILK